MPCIPSILFLLALGNRSQCSRWGYTLGFVTIHITEAAFLLVYKGIQSVAQSEGRSIQATDLFTNSIFTEGALSSAATLGLYIVAPLIFVRAVTYDYCFPPVSAHGAVVLNIYANEFPNVHDVSWGTKGDNKVNADLGVAESEPVTYCIYSHEPQKFIVSPYVGDREIT